jgi:cytoskeletal protein RodZ
LTGFRELWTDGLPAAYNESVCRRPTRPPVYPVGTGQRETREAARRQAPMLKAWLMRKLGLLLLGVWLVITGMVALGVRITGVGQLLAILAIAAGLLVILGR